MRFLQCKNALKYVCGQGSAAYFAGGGCSHAAMQQNMCFVAVVFYSILLRVSVLNNRSHAVLRGNQ